MLKLGTWSQLTWFLPKHVMCLNYIIYIMFMVLCETVSFPLSTEQTQGELVKISLLEILQTNQMTLLLQCFSENLVLHTGKVFSIYSSKQYRKQPLLWCLCQLPESGRDYRIKLSQLLK